LNDLPNAEETIMKPPIASTKLSRLLAAATFGALALSCGAGAAAARQTDVSQTVVKFGDLNLSNPQGAATLYRRIVVAAHEVCGSFDVDSIDFAARALTNACVHKAIADAVTKVGQSELFAVYDAKNHQSLPIAVAAAQAR
jgi:UrcA family protein